MHKIDTQGATGDAKFTDGNQAQGVAATVIDAAWMNAVQEELIAVLEAGGVTPAKGTWTQVRDAIYQIIVNRGVDLAANWFSGTLGTVSSSTSGAVGTAKTWARGDHSHNLGAHDHSDATKGGVIVAASATQTGAVTTVAQTFGGKKTFNTPPQIQVVQSGIAAGSGTLDASAYDTFMKTGSASATNIGLNNLYEGQTISVLISTVASQAAITWKRGTDTAGVADVKWNGGIVPTPTTTAGRYDRYIFQMLGGVIFGSADMNCY